MPLLFADLFSAARTSLSGRSNDEFDVGVACGRQARLRWRPVDLFPHRLCKTPVLKESISDHYDNAFLADKSPPCNRNHGFSRTRYPQ